MLVEESQKSVLPSSETLVYPNFVMQVGEMAKTVFSASNKPFKKELKILTLRAAKYDFVRNFI